MTSQTATWLSAPKKERSSGSRQFWLSMLPTILIAILFYGAGFRLAAGVLLLVQVCAISFVIPSVAIYVAFALQAWDPFFTQPFFYLEPFGFVNPSKIFGVLVSALVAARLGSGPRFPPAIRWFAVIAILFACYGLTIAPLSADPVFATRNAAQVLILVLFVVGAVMFISTPRQISRLFFWTALGSFSASLLLIATQNRELNVRGALGELGSANVTAMALATGMMAIPAAWGFARSKFAWFVYSAMAVTIMVALMITGSRAACVGVTLSYSFGGIFAPGRGGVQKISATLFASILGAAVFFVVLDSGILPPRTQERLEALVYRSNEAIEGLSRFAIWRNALKTFSYYPISGVGMGNTAAAMSEVVVGEARDAHSNYVAVLTETGLIGFGLAMTMGMAVLMAVWKIPRANPSVPATMLILYVVLIGMTHTTYMTKFFWMPLALALVLARYGLSQADCAAVPMGGQELAPPRRENRL